MGGFARLFWILAAFFFVATTAYGIWAYLSSAQRLAYDPSGETGTPSVEWTGTTALGLCTVMAVLIAFYLRRTHRGQGGELPADRMTANIDDGDAEQGHFSPWSWWPFILGVSAALGFLGLAIGVWITIIGAGLFVVAITGWVYEYYRGYFGR